MVYVVSDFIWLHCRYVCVKCFREIQRDTITVGDDPLTAPKASFKEMKNNTTDKEG